MFFAIYTLRQRGISSNYSIDLGHFSRFHIALLTLAFIYIALSSLILGYSLDGQAIYQNNQYILEYKGKIVRSLSEREYHDHHADELRYFSNWWLIAYLFLFILFEEQLNTQDHKSHKFNDKG